MCVIKRVTEIHALQEEYPNLFKGLGAMIEPYTIELEKDAKPFAIYSPRRIPLPLMNKVKDELSRMEQMGVISKISEPTEWCAGMVVVPKPNGQVRICVDLTQLNKSVKRETHPLPPVDHTLAQLAGSTVFSKLDANSGFWQIPLSPESAKLTTFLTPFGRYHFNRLPFGISSAPEHFQRRMLQILDGLDGVECLMDDVLIHGPITTIHDERLRAVVERMEAAGVTLNVDKCELSKPSMKFLGHVIDANGIHADPAKVKAVTDLEPPKTASEVRRILGMVNQLGKFIPDLAEKTQPMRELLSKKNAWHWDQNQQKAFDEMKQALINSPVLAHCDVKAPKKVSADASSFGLGAVLLQKKETADKNSTWKPVAYASRAMTSVEQRYAQIEKESLAVTWACEKFSHYLIGTNFVIETYHKPLVPLLGSKDIAELLARIQRFRMRLMKLSYSVVHVPGKDVHTADTRSRAPIADFKESDQQLQEETQVFVDMVMNDIPATEKKCKK